ncbi:MAG: SDR family oxidoreductase [Puniceicoccales bacterium]|jgi:NAD(P)-dependent dehydrogenase (short-subunit alcohol dehydrogenase family)|nr:SDR family oxidoreductase [Puniceicoccales bacterium]
MKKLELTDKVALITGAAGAIGKAVAQQLQENGATIVLTDIAEAKVKAVAAELGEGIQAFGADITNEADVRHVVNTAYATHKHIDILVNVAGIVGQGRVEDITQEEWEKMFAVNCRGTFLFTKYTVPHMKENKRGKIINFSSKSGKTGSALMSHYCAAKGAIIAFTQALAYELADFNINVNCVCPGITDNSGVWANVSAGYTKNLNLPKDEVVKKFTAKIPLKRLATVNDIAAVTTFLASPGSDYMTGQAINITGGREMH